MERPKDGFNGNPASIGYTITDDAGLISDQSTVTVEYDQSLPIKLTYFKAQQKKHCEVQLHWQTAEETDAAAFAIERSFDGRQFDVIADIPVRGSGTSYQFTDVPVNSGNIYYRLRMIDNNLSYEYSRTETVIVKCNGRGNKRIYPTQFDQTVTIEGLEKGERIIVLNALGRQVYEAAVNKSTMQLQLGHLTGGLYFVTIFKAGQVQQTFKIFKK